MLLNDGLLLSNLQAGFLALNFFVVAHQLLRDDWLRHSYCDNLDARGPFVSVSLQRGHKLLVKGVEQVNINLLKRMFAAKLVDLVATAIKIRQILYLLNFVENPCFVVLDGVVTDCVKGKVFVKPIDDLNLTKSD